MKMKVFLCIDLLAVFIIIFLCGFSLGKECTNIPTQLSSHSFRYELLSSHNETRKEEMFSYYHLIPTDDSAWMNLLPRKILREEDENEWAMMYRKMKNPNGFEASGGFLKEVSLHDVRLDPTSQHGRAQQTNLEYLLMLDSDSLLWSFRKTAGLPTIGTPYKGWEEPTGELRGHFVGHYLSASALMWASTHNNTLRDKMSAIVDNLYLCQKKIGSGYLSAFPSKEFDRFEAIKPVWAPYYTIHKGDTKHLLLAHLFDKPCFLGLLAVQEMGIFFLNIVNSSHSYATGGTSVSEFWSDPKRLASTLQTENEESCTTYNMLKVSRHQFKWTKEIAYADYYERALTNGVLGIQRGTEPGVMIYMLPLGRGDSKARSYHGWGKPFESFLCCYGTGIESFSKLADSIYFEEGGEVPGLYIIQYISSLLDWKSGQIVLNQTVDQVNSWDTYLRVTLTFSSKEGTGKSSTLNLRTPTWTASNGAKAALNGQSLSVPAPDDRPEYASIQAILYGPYLLAAHTSGNWDIETGSANSIADWITSIPSSYNNFLVSFSQEYGNSKFAIAVTNQSIALDVFPETGTDAFAHATFRLILNDLSTKLSTVNDAIGKSVILELFDLPGKVLVQQGKDKNLGIADLSSSKDSSVFRLIPGLDGKNTTVSLESESFKGCFVYSEKIVASAGLKLICSPESSDAVFNQAASFVKSNGISIILSALWLKEQQGAFF